MAKASAKRVAKKLREKAAAATAVADAIEAKPSNGLIELDVGEALKYKLLAMQNALEKHIAEKATVEAKIAEAERDKARVINEIVESFEDRLEGKYKLDIVSFVTGKGVFSLKEPGVEEKKS